jgi:hypothetical protein
MTQPASSFQDMKRKARTRLLNRKLGKTPIRFLLPLLQTSRLVKLIFLVLFVSWMVFLISPRSDGTLLGNYTMRPPGFRP